MVIKRVTRIFDVCAAMPVVHSKLLRNVKHSVRCIPGRKFVTANSKPIGRKFFATFRIVAVVIGKRVKLQDALIMYSWNVPILLRLESC